MNAAANSGIPGVGILVRIIFVILVLVALYYLYNYLFSSAGLEGKIVLNTVTVAAPSSPIVIVGEKLPALYEGGEFSVNTWIYITDYSVNRGRNKHVFSIGGSSFTTLAVYLGAYKSSLSVRVHTRNGGGSSINIGGPSASPSDASDTLTTEVVKSLFNSLQTDSSLIDNNRPCDVPNLELQKWLQLTICLNNKTCDVYLDGKLARSCVLPSFYKVDKVNLAMSLCSYGGFGGYISNTSVYNYALNPEQTWKLYMAGPGPQYGFVEWIKSLFNPESANTLDFPKMNIPITALNPASPYPPK